MAFDFPIPTFTGQQFTPAGGPTFAWNGYAWDLASPGVVPAAGLVPLQVKVVAAGAASVDFTGIDATYDEYEIHYNNIKLAADSALGIRVSSDNGATFKNAASYYYSNYFLPPTGANAGAFGASLQTVAQPGFAIASASSALAHGEIRTYRLWDATIAKYMMWRGVHPGSSEHYYFDGFGAWFGDFAAINAIQIFPQTGTSFTQGTFVLYGRAKGPLQAVTPIGSRVLLQSITPGAGNVIVVGANLLTLDYDIFEIDYMLQAATTNSQLNMLMSTDGGATFISSAGAYNYTFHYSQSSGAGGPIGAANNFLVAGVSLSNGVNVFGTGTIRTFRPWQAGITKQIRFVGEGYDGSANLTEIGGAGALLATSAPINALRLGWSTGGNFQASGFVNLYGIKK